MKQRMKRVDEVNYGVYVWRVPGLGILGNEDGDVLRIFSMKGDLGKIKQLQVAAAHYGYPEGSAEFWSGYRPVSHSEWEDQMERQIDGKIADPYDIPALIDEYKKSQEAGADD